MVVNYLTLINELYSFDTNGNGGELILVYKDEINTENLDRILAITEYKINNLTEERSIKKKMFNVLVEAAQNILKHGEGQSKISDLYKSMLVIGREGAGFFIISGNVTKREKAEALKSRLNIINDLNDVGLKQLYNKSIQENPFSDKGGAGLGLIDIARKTGHKIAFTFHDLDKEFTYLSMKSSFSSGQ